MPQQSWILVACATLLAASEPQTVPNRDGLKEAWFQAIYAIEPNPSHGFTAQNAAQNLKLTFGPSEARLVHGDAAVAIRLMGFGRDGQLHQPDAPFLSSSKNRVEYRHGALTEWFVNDSTGLEQGFTLDGPPSGTGRIEIALRMNGTLHPKLEASGEVALLDARGRATLRYGGVKAWDARGHALDSRIAVANEFVRLIVDDTDAVYPITIDPTLTQITLVPNDPASSTRFGQSVAISGTTAVIGAPAASGTVGAAYIFITSGGSWQQQAKLTASDGVIGDQFGTAVSIDGQNVVVGAPFAAGKGAAYVFAGSGSTWTQQAKLTGSDSAGNDQFGISVGISGTTAVVGASNAVGHGAAYVFTSSSGTWSQQGELTDPDPVAGDLYGTSVSISASTIVVGVPGRANSQGSAFVYATSGSAWIQQALLIAADGATGDKFGSSVAVSGDSAVVGAPNKGGIYTPIGVAYTFSRSGATWTQQAKLESSDGGGAFGYSVGLSGSTAIVGEIFNSQLRGAAFIFVRSGSTWTSQATLNASDTAPGLEFGASVAVSGSTAISGTPNTNSQRGSAYFFAQSGAAWTQQAEIVPADATSGDAFGNALSVSGETALVGAGSKGSNTGAAYVFVRSATDGTWSQQAKLTVPGLTSGASFGESVSLSGDTALIGSSLAAYVFVRSGTNWSMQTKLTPSDPPQNFGFAVALDGDTAVVPDFGQNGGRGAGYVFVRSGSTWTQQAKLSPSDAAANDLVGRSVSVNGDTAVLGGSVQNSFQGGAYVFARTGTTWAQQAKLTASDGASGDNFAYSVSVSGDTIIAGAYNKGGGEGAAYVFVRSGPNWTQQAKLQASDAQPKYVFGIAVSVDGDLATVGANNINSGQGAAYVFARSGSTWSQTMKLTAADGAAGDHFGQTASINGGTLIVGAPSHDGAEGIVYVFLLPTLPDNGLVNAASFAHTVAPGSIASAFGTNYADSNIGASVKPLPDTLGNVSITVNNVAAPLIFVGQFQANFQVPFETKPGTATVIVTSNGIASQPATVAVTAEAPGIFVTGTNQAVALNADNTVADDSHPAKIGSVVVMYVTGLGALDHPIPTGSPASSSPLSNAVVVPTATLGGVNAVVQFAGMSPGFVGLGQINLQIPKLAKGSYPVVLKQGGQTSNNPVISVTP